MIYLLLFIAGAIAWLISTVAAGGAAMLLIPLLGLALAPQAVAPTITIAALMANPSRTFVFWDHIAWPVVRYLLPGSVIGAVLGAFTFTLVPAALLQFLLGLFLLSTIWQFQFGKRKRSFAMPLSGFLPLGLGVAFISGLIGGTGPVMNPFFLNHGLEKEQLVATKAFNSLALQSTKLISYIGLGAVGFEIGLYGLAIGMGGVFGVFWARHHLNKINDQRFRQYTLWLMPIGGIVLIAKAISDQV
ncbi:MAG: sulfite exporter TauE/SafE family protein [Cellvibrionaceae bacterium]|nr:sulfite exporter TauE/SafE family protein [Cellvibrionaceae bacterium]